MSTKLTVREALENTPNLSLRKLAIATECSYGVLLKAAKKPVPGEVYNPEFMNYEAVDAIFEKKGIDLSELNLEEIAGEARPKAIKENDLRINEQYSIRGTDVVYEIISLTKSHVCIRATTENELGEEVLRAMSINTFLHQSPKRVNAE